MNFATTRFMPRSCIKISDTVVFGQISFWFSHCQSLIFADCSPDTFNVLSCSACCRPSRTCITFNRFLTIFEAFVPDFYLCFTHCIVPNSLLNHLKTFHGGMFKLNTKFDADSWLSSLSHFECVGHTVHILTQWRLPPPLTSTEKSSLFTHAHSSPLRLAASYIAVTQTVFVILTMAGLFPDRPRVHLEKKWQETNEWPLTYGHIYSLLKSVF